MHEMALVRDIVETVLDVAEESHATQVKEVYLSIGRARDIVMDLFDYAFGYLTRGTIAEGAELVVDQVPIMAQCQDCGAIFHLDVFDEGSWECTRCGSKNYKLHSGREFRIDRIEAIFDKGERGGDAAGAPAAARAAGTPAARFAGAPATARVAGAPAAARAVRAPAADAAETAAAKVAVV